MSKKRIILECECNKFLDHVTPCCDFFKRMINDCAVRLQYSEKHKMYGIIIIGSGSIQGILYCPWCATKLPYPEEEEES